MKNSVTNKPICQVCNKGQLNFKKIYRMSAPVVIIGYLLLIPSILGMLLGMLLIFTTGGAATSTTMMLKNEIKGELSLYNIPDHVIEKTLNNETLSFSEENSLTSSQKEALTDAKLSYNAGLLGAGAGTVFFGGISIFITISSFIGGLLGWLLVMKKKVLQCINCNSVVAAS